MVRSQDDLDIVRDIADVVGAEAAEAFQRAFGGTRVYIPKRLNRRHPIAEAVGYELARKIVDALVPSTGIYVGVPIGRFSSSVEQRQHQHASIDAMIAQGLTRDVIAKRVGCSGRTVQRRRRALTRAGHKLTPTVRAFRADERLP